MTMKKTIMIIGLAFLLSCIKNHACGQISISYQYSSLNKIGVAYNFSQRFWAEFKIYSNTYFEDITPEMTFMYNISVKENHEIYAGIGGVANYISGIVFPVGLQVRPFENFRRFSFQIEIEPTVDTQNEDLLLQSSAGIRYTFGKSKN